MVRPSRRPTAADGDLAQFLDIDMDEVAAVRRVHPADDAAGRTIQPPQFGQAVVGKHVVHRGDVQTQQISDPCRPPPADDPDLMMRRSVRIGVRLGLR
jgi:hypothetical protein